MTSYHELTEQKELRTCKTRDGRPSGRGGPGIPNCRRIKKKVIMKTEGSAPSISMFHCCASSLCSFCLLACWERDLAALRCGRLFSLRSRLFCAADWAAFGAGRTESDVFSSVASRFPVGLPTAFGTRRALFCVGTEFSQNSAFIVMMCPRCSRRC